MYLLSKLAYILLSTVSECALLNTVPLVHASWLMYLSTRSNAFIHPVNNIAVRQPVGLLDPIRNVNTNLWQLLHLLRVIFKFQIVPSVEVMPVLLSVPL